MFLDPDGPGGEPLICDSCKLPIWSDPVVISGELGGTYHRGCAGVYLGLHRVRGMRLG